MLIHDRFPGGNITVEEIRGDTVTLKNQLRDTTEDWFYWAFCVEGAEGKTLTFRFERFRLGYFGPAVSHDLVRWEWLNEVDGDSFTYRFGEDEHRVWFAHDMLYHPDRFLRFADRHGLNVKELCRGYRGSGVPCVTIGEGSVPIILTARHHACEATGSYVLEGVLDELIARPIPDTRIFCVPFVDYEGVIRGDQGKRRAPHDHNGDYDRENGSIYPECVAIRRFADENGCRYGFDFHSPWHLGGQNDHAFLVQKSLSKLPRLNRFGELFEGSITDGAFRYEHKNDYPPYTGWNQRGHTFARYMMDLPGNEIACTLETPYFGTPGNRASEASLLELGHCFARALGQYIKEKE